MEVVFAIFGRLDSIGKEQRTKRDISATIVSLSIALIGNIASMTDILYKGERENCN